MASRGALAPVNIQGLLAAKQHGLLPTGDMRAHQPTLRDMLAEAAANAGRTMGLGDILAQRMRDEAAIGADFMPGIGAAVGGEEAGRDIGRGNYLSGGLGLAMSMVPGGKAANAGIRALPSSSSLNLPRPPSLDELAKFARRESVPLDKARGSQRKMEWDKNVRAEYGVPMFEGYTDAPVAVRKRDGEYIIIDGHHRTANALNEGQTELPMYVIDAEVFDPENAGKAPVSDDTDLDALLKELGL